MGRINRGGPRGPRKFHGDNPTRKEQVLSESFADFIFEKTGIDVDPLHIRAIQFCQGQWAHDPEKIRLSEYFAEQTRAKMAIRKAEKLALERGLI